MATKTSRKSAPASKRKSSPVRRRRRSDAGKKRKSRGVVKCNPFDPVNEPICPPGEMSHGGSCIPSCPDGDLFGLEDASLNSPVLSVSGNKIMYPLSGNSHNFCPENILHKVVKGMKYIAKKYKLNLCKNEEGVTDKDRFNANFEIDWKTGKIYEAKMGYKRDDCSGQLKFIPELYLDEVLNGNFPSALRLPGCCEKKSMISYKSDYNIKNIIDGGEAQTDGNPYVISFDKFTVNKFTRRIEAKCPNDPSTGKAQFRNRFGQCVKAEDIYGDCSPVQEQLNKFNLGRMALLEKALEEPEKEACTDRILLKDAISHSLADKDRANGEVIAGMRSNADY